MPPAPETSPENDVPLSSEPGPSALVEQLLSRPAEQRLREYKYRCAQSIVFGIPVLFLEYFGASLGGPESRRWVAVMQALLAGWVIYVGATGMLFEGLILAVGRRRVTVDLLVSVVAVSLYCYSLVATLGVVTAGNVLYEPLLFHVSVALVAGWTGWRWWRLSRAAAPGASPAARVGDGDRP